MSLTLTSLCEEFWEWRLKETPEFASFCGFHQYDHLLADMSTQAFINRGETCKMFLSRANRIEEATLNDSENLTLLLLRDQLLHYIQGLKHEGYLNQMNSLCGIHGEFRDFIDWMKFNSEDDYIIYIKRLESLADRVKQTIESFKTAVQKKKTYCSYSMKGVLDMVQEHTLEAKETLFWKPFKSYEDGERMEAIAEEGINVIHMKVAPAFQELHTFLNEVYMNNLRPDIAISSWPEGRAFYEASLQAFLGLDLTPEEVHQIGLDETARIKTLIQEVIAKTGFKGDFKSFLSHFRANPNNFFDDKEELLEAYENICQNVIRPKLTTLFHKLPSTKLQIEFLPGARPNLPAAWYRAGTVDGSRKGKFCINGSNLKACPKNELMTLALHEGEPGHHLQSMYAIEMKNVPLFRRYSEDCNYWAFPSRFPIYGAYIEGWGLYCETLGKELGLYEDPYNLFAHYCYEMFRACRLIADTGIHAFKWSREQAFALFQENTALDDEHIYNEVDRYITVPAQACTYKVGEMKIQQLREKAEKTLGDKFNVKDFHQEILQCGTVPLNILEQVIDKYIERQFI